MSSEKPQEADSFESSPDRCRYFEGLFSPYIDGELETGDRRALAEHLHNCESCSQKFGYTWRGLAKDPSNDSGRRFGTGKRKKKGNQRRTLWMVMLASAVAVIYLFGNDGKFGSNSGRGFNIPRGRTIVDEEVARMMALNNRVIGRLVDALDVSGLHVSHAARGEARDFFEALGKADPEETRILAPFFHSLFRAVDTKGFQRIERDVKSMLSHLNASGMPQVVLVEVKSADRNALLCSITWGKRPAYAWLVREAPQDSKAEGQKEEDPEEGDSEKPSFEGTFRLAELWFRTP